MGVLWGRQLLQWCIHFDACIGLGVQHQCEFRFAGERKVSGAAVSLICRSSRTGAVFTTAATVSNHDTADCPAGSFSTQMK